MNQFKKGAGIAIYSILAAIVLFTWFSGYEDVCENLDGWHNFSKSHSMLFVVICISFILCCIYNIKGFFSNSLCNVNFILSVALFILPIIFQLISSTLQGNVDTDFQYLLLRTFQGFEHTYIFISLSALIGTIILKLKN